MVQSNEVEMREEETKFQFIVIWSKASSMPKRTHQRERFFGLALYILLGKGK